ncbi:MAG: hypothetical protein U0Y96_10215 [Candidatus Kapaibacterium sp.]
MKSSVIRLFLCTGVVLVLMFGFTHAQDPVTVILVHPPPNQMRLADLWRVTLINTTQQPKKIYLHGTGTEQRDGLIVDAQTREFDLPPGTKVVTGSFVQPIKVNKSNDRYKNIITNTGTVPSGDYTICLDAVEVGTNIVLGRDCFEQRIEQMSPPVLVSPDNGESALDSLPNFSWLPPTPLPIDIRVVYSLKIVEVLGVQTPQQAMISNPAHFENARILPTVFNYPISARQIASNKKYAWKIIAYSSDGYVIGESEVWWFKRMDIVPLSNKKTIPKDEVKNPVVGGIMSAGDCNSSAIVETVQQPKGSLELVNSLYANGSVGNKNNVVNDKTFTSDFLNKNYTAAEIGKLSVTTTPGSDKSASSSTAGFSLSGSKLTLSNDALNNVKTNLGTLISQPNLKGMLWCWGRNLEGQTGFLAPEWFSDVPLPYDLKDIIQIACGANHTLVLLKDGSVWAWGDNQFGQLADATIRERNYAVKINGLSNIKMIAAGLATSYALGTDGNIYSWGYNVTGELGTGATSHDTSKPLPVSKVYLDATEKFVAVAAREGHAMAISNKGKLYAWGSNYYGEVGNGAKQRYSVVPEFIGDAPIAGGAGASLAMFTINSVGYRAIACGDHHSAIVLTNGDVYTWGRNASGQLGTETYADTVEPYHTKVGDADSIACGAAHTLIRKKDYSLMVCGNNMAGQLGDGKQNVNAVPTALPDFLVTTIAAGSGHSMAIKKTGGLWTWGNHNSGQLGYSPINDVIFLKKPMIPPTRVTTLEQ